MIAKLLWQRCKRLLLVTTMRAAEYFPADELDAGIALLESLFEKLEDDIAF